MNRAPHDHHPVKVMIAKSAEDMIRAALGCRYCNTTLIFIVLLLYPPGISNSDVCIYWERKCWVGQSKGVKVVVLFLVVMVALLQGLYY